MLEGDDVCFIPSTCWIVARDRYCVDVYIYPVCIFPILFRDFTAQERMSISTPPIMTLRTFSIPKKVRENN